jgi:hypothetical protein
LNIIEADSLGSASVRDDDGPETGCARSDQSISYRSDARGPRISTNTMTAFSLPA